MRVFEYVVFYVPSESDKKADAKLKAEIVIEGKLIEKDQATAQVKVTRLIDEKWDEKMDDLTIAIRPF